VTPDCPTPWIWRHCDPPNWRVLPAQWSSVTSWRLEPSAAPLWEPQILQDERCLEADGNSMARFQPTGGDRKHQVLAVTIVRAVHLGRLCASGCWRVCVVVMDSCSLYILFTADSWKCLWIEFIFLAARLYHVCLTDWIL